MKTAEYKIDHYEVTEFTDDYRIIDGLTYWEDVNHLDLSISRKKCMTNMI